MTDADLRVPVRVPGQAMKEAGTIGTTEGDDMADMNEFLQTSVDTSSRTLTEQDIRDAYKRELERHHPSPCGTEDNPHVMHLADLPDGPCINCGGMKPEEG